jgi:dihydrofolate synthase/folylpolyglutamate synthase
LEAILKEAGFVSNVYTSPNLIFLNERIKISGRYINNEELLSTLSQIPQSVSFFEAITAAAFVLFAKSNATFSLIEAGLGGRFDATNVINSKLCILTSVSLDHTEYLGETIEKIAKEKLAVEKNCPFIIANQPFEEVYSYASSLQNPIIYGEDFEIKQKDESLIYKSKRLNLTLKKPALFGRHQFYNASTAICAVEVLKFNYGFAITEEAVIKGLLSAKWRARMENITTGKISLQFPHLDVFLDGAHNENGIEVILKELEEFSGEIHVICGFLKRKDLTKIIPKFALVKNIHLTEIHSSEEARTIKELKEEFAKAKIAVISAEKYFYEVLSLIKNPAKVIILGSLYLAGEVLFWNEYES